MYTWGVLNVRANRMSEEERRLREEREREERSAREARRKMACTLAYKPDGFLGQGRRRHDACLQRAGFLYSEERVFVPRGLLKSKGGGKHGYITSWNLQLQGYHYASFFRQSAQFLRRHRWLVPGARSASRSLFSTQHGEIISLDSGFCAWTVFPLSLSGIW